MGVTPLYETTGIMQTMLHTVHKYNLHTLSTTYGVLILINCPKVTKTFQIHNMNTFSKHAMCLCAYSCNTDHPPESLEKFTHVIHRLYERVLTHF